MWDTLRPGLEWQVRIDRANAEMAADNQRTQAEISRIQAATQRETMAHIALRGQIRAQTQRDVAEINQNGWRARQQSNARMHTDHARTVREVQAYRDPRGGGVVELSHHYRHAWQLRDGTYVLTNNPGFSPERDAGIGGVQLERTE